MKMTVDLGELRLKYTAESETGAQMIYDISVTLEPEMPTWPGTHKMEIIARKRMKNGDPSNASTLYLSAHQGTHMDAPFHYWDEGYGIDELPVELLIGPARVFELSEVNTIGEEELKPLDLSGVSRALFKTKSSSFWTEKAFRRDYVSFTPTGAAYVASTGVKLVGIDYLSVAGGSDEQPLTHNAFARKGIVILEGLDLSRVTPGDYELICLPIKVKGCDGAPARALLRTFTR
jgi:arylformamidase